MLLLENASQLAQVLATSEIKPLFDVLPSAQLSSTLKPSIKFASPTAVSIINTLLSINAWIFALITLTQTQQPSFALIHVPSAISHRIKYAFKTAPRVTQIHSWRYVYLFAHLTTTHTILNGTAGKIANLNINSSIIKHVLYRAQPHKI